jgi:hypothetical protein
MQLIIKFVLIQIINKNNTYQTNIDISQITITFFNLKMQ